MDESTGGDTTDSSNSTNKSSSTSSTSITGDILMHLQAMITLLRPNDTIILAVKLFSYVQEKIRYLVIVETRSTASTSRTSLGGGRVASGGEYCDESALLGLELTPLPTNNNPATDDNTPNQKSVVVFERDLKGSSLDRRLI